MAVQGISPRSCSIVFPTHLFGRKGVHLFLHHFAEKMTSLRVPCEDTWRFPSWRRQLHQILTAPSAGPSLRSVIGVPSWKRVWEDIPVASWPKDAISRCRRLHRALRRPKVVRSPFGVRDCTNFWRRSYCLPVISYVDDMCLSLVGYPDLSVILEQFRRKIRSGSFLYKIDLRKCFSHAPVLPGDAPADGASMMLLGLAFGIRASEMMAIRMMP